MQGQLKKDKKKTKTESKIAPDLGLAGTCKTGSGRRRVKQIQCVGGVTMRSNHERWV